MNEKDNPREVLLTIEKCAQGIRRRLLKTLDEFEITPEQWQILETLEAGSLAQSQLGLFLAKDRHTLSRSLDLLESQELIKREKINAKSNLILLTEKALLIFPIIQKKMGSCYESMANSLDVLEKKIIISSLRSLISLCD